MSPAELRDRPLALEEFDGLEAGDQIAAGPLWPVLPGAHITLTVTLAKPGTRAVKAHVLGVLLGTWTVRRVGDSLTWDFD